MRILARLLAAILFFTLVVDVQVAEAATKPSAPRSVKATPGNGSVKITWRAPASSGGARIDKYAVQRWAPSTERWLTVKTTSGSARSWTNTGRTNGVKYFYRVRAHNRRGWGPVSKQVSATPRTVPTAPRFLEADTYSSALGAFWSTPASTGGAAIDYYRVEISLDGAAWTGARNRATAAIKASPEMFTGLTPGTRYWLRVRAHNAAGFSVGTSSGPYRAITAPGPVTDLEAVVGTGQVELTWTAPESTPSAPATAMYRIEQSDDDGATWTESGTTANDSFVVTGLTNGTTYTFRVSARSTIERVGYGTPVEISPNAPTGPPTTPQNVSLGWEALSSTNVLNWEPPANDGGIDLTRYVVEYWTVSTPPPYPTFTFTADTLQGTAGALALDHTFRVKACNGPAEDDCGPWSAEVGPIPGQVTNATIEDVRVGITHTVTLDWEAPANDLVAPASSYEVLRSTDGGVTFATLATVTGTEYTDLTTAPDTDYSYRIVALGDSGSGQPRDLDVTTGPAYELSVPASPVDVTEGSDTTFDVTIEPGVTQATDVTVTSDDPGAATGVVLAPGVGDTTVTVQVVGVEDDDLAPETVTLTVVYGDEERTVTVEVADDDTQALIVSGAPSVVDIDDPEPSTFTVALAHQPAGPVTVNVASSAPGKASVSPTTLTFLVEDWDIPQEVTITGISPDNAVTISVTSDDLTDVTFDVEVNP